MLLHGIIYVDVMEAKHMPRTLAAPIQSTFHCINQTCCFTVPSGGEYYVVFYTGKTRRASTRVVHAGLNASKARWDEKFEIYVADNVDTVKFQLKDAAVVVGAEVLGQVKIAVSDLLAGDRVDQVYKLYDVKSGKPLSKGLEGRKHSSLHVSLRYQSLDAIEKAVSKIGMAKPARYWEVPNTFYPLRIGNSVRLYRDAHQEHLEDPQIKLGDGKIYAEHGAWDDVYDDVMQAQSLIYITGWSVWSKLVLKRGNSGTCPCLGDILKQKAEKGVKVLLLIWDDMSNNLLSGDGLMATHDENTFAFFKESHVICQKAVRKGGSKDSLFRAFTTNNCYTHHQKTIILDRAVKDGKPGRELVSYVGGLDLTDGRYDTAQHPLFTTLEGVHKEDFHQACIPGFDPSKGGPREPWHDIHSRLEGPVAYDVLHNFEDRWKRQAKITHRGDLLSLNEIKGLQVPDSITIWRLQQHAQSSLRERAKTALKADGPKDFLKHDGHHRGHNEKGRHNPWFHSVGATVFGKTDDERQVFSANLAETKNESGAMSERDIRRQNMSVLLDRIAGHAKDNPEDGIENGTENGIGPMTLGDDATGYEDNDVAVTTDNRTVAKTSQHKPDFWKRAKGSLRKQGIKLPQLELPELNMPDTQHQWCTQLFRSIDSGSVASFPRHPYDVFHAGLSNGKGRAIDDSIHRAYITAIRRSRRFIYIENQYFLGSSHLWSKEQDASASHLVPAELALKIVDHIQMGERFAVYVLLPLYPEGIPGSGSVQAILRWQRNTIGTMYRLIAEALKEYGPADALPTDYLMFFALGAREPEESAIQDVAIKEDPNAPNTTQADNAQAKIQNSRRFMIYVHSKMMVVDDEYAIVGSANINQRSLDGTRDTEIAIGAYQPAATVAALGASARARGDIYAFRKALWKEHTLEAPDVFDNPESIECVRELKRIARQNWDNYASDEVRPLQGHLMLYPYEVLEDGNLQNIQGHENFPDFPDAKVFGTKSNTLPAFLTT